LYLIPTWGVALDFDLGQQQPRKDVSHCILQHLNQKNIKESHNVFVNKKQTPH